MFPIVHILSVVPIGRGISNLCRIDWDVATSPFCRLFNHPSIHPFIHPSIHPCMHASIRKKRHMAETNAHPPEAWRTSRPLRGQRPASAARSRRGLACCTRRDGSRGWGQTQSRQMHKKVQRGKRMIIAVSTSYLVYYTRCEV